MYTVLYLFALAFTLLGTNWVVGLYGFVSLTAIIVPRLPQEVVVLYAHFGEQYQRYAVTPLAEVSYDGVHVLAANIRESGKRHEVVRCS